MTSTAAPRTSRGPTRPAGSSGRSRSRRHGAASGRHRVPRRQHDRDQRQLCGFVDNTDHQQLRGRRRHARAALRLARLIGRATPFHPVRRFMPVVTVLPVLLGRAARMAGQVEGRVDQRQVRERLREIAQQPLRLRDRTPRTAGPGRWPPRSRRSNSRCGLLAPAHLQVACRPARSVHGRNTPSPGGSPSTRVLRARCYSAAGSRPSSGRARWRATVPSTRSSLAAAGTRPAESSAGWRPARGGRTTG